MTTMTLRAGAQEWPPLADLGDASTRRELSAAAAPALARLIEKWGMTTEQACALLGGISPSTWYAWKHNPPRELSVDQLTRVSLLLGIYSALHALFREPLANEWVTRPNTNELFGGRAPVEVMARGGIVALSQVRSLLDAARGGS